MAKPRGERERKGVTCRTGGLVGYSAESETSVTREGEHGAAKINGEGI